MKDEKTTDAGSASRRRSSGYDFPDALKSKKEASGDRLNQAFSGDFTGERFLKNPLPVPKRRPHVRMEFDLTDDWDIPEEQDHFDLEIDEDDEFDL